MQTLRETGLPVVAINTPQLRAFAVAVGQLAKTDRIDAQLIVRFGRDAHPEERPLPQENQTYPG